MKIKYLSIFSIILIFIFSFNGCDFIISVIPGEIKPEHQNNNGKFDDITTEPLSIQLEKPLPFAVLDMIGIKSQEEKSVDENTPNTYVIRNKRDWEPLRSTTNLTSISIDDWVGINDLSMFSSLINLTTLSISTHSFDSFSGLESLTQLTNLNINTASLAAWDLSYLKNLTHLSISTESKYVGWALLESIASLPNITELRLKCNLEDISRLAPMTQLKFLDLSDNNIKDASLLSKFINLESLNLQNNQITDISPLASLVNLKNLDLQNNQIDSITPLSYLEKLSSLKLSSNKIATIEPLRNLLVLNTLWLGNNQINDISPLTSLSGIKELLLDGNPLDDYSISTATPLLKEKGATVYIWNANEYDDILRIILNMKSDIGRYNIINPEMSFESDDSFVAATISRGGSLWRFRESLKAAGYDATTLLEVFYERNLNPILMNIPSSPKEGYIIDYKNIAHTYFDEEYRDGWKKFRIRNPKAISYVTISAPVYDPKNGIVIVYYGSSGGFLEGGGYLVAFKYQNNHFEGIACMELWIS